MMVLLILLAAGIGPLAAAALLAAAHPALVAITARVAWWRAERPTTPDARAADAVWLSTLRALNASRRAEAVAR